MTPVDISAYTLTCAVGSGIAAIRNRLEADRSGLSNEPWPDSNIATWLGRVDGLDRAEENLPDAYESRNNRLARLALGQDEFSAQLLEKREQFGAQRCGLVLGTSTSSIGRTEASYLQLTSEEEFAAADRHGELHNPHSTTEFVARELGIAGPAVTVSTACSSSARAFASAARWLACDIVDVVVVGGVDTLCLSVICGFNSLQLVSEEPCRPFDSLRSGLSLGEAAGFALLTRESPGNPAPLQLLGYGESLDAYHMSSAHPDGLGAKLAMEAAVKRAGVEFSDIDYLNLHGTGTRANDKVEGLATRAAFGRDVLCSSTKGWTGHTLGAAGITEAILAFDALLTGLVPGTINTRELDIETQLPVLLKSVRSDPRLVMSNSFGFGGNNCSLIFGGAHS